MRELVVENQEVLLIPQDYKFANRGKVTAVRAGDFTLELEYEPENILLNTYCEFYTQTPHGKLYFDSYAKEINGKTLIIASPAKHKDVNILVSNSFMICNYIWMEIITIFRPLIFLLVV